MAAMNREPADNSSGVEGQIREVVRGEAAAERRTRRKPKARWWQTNSAR
jgi:hypothetical protein